MKGYEFSISPKGQNHKKCMTLNEFDEVVCKTFEIEPHSRRFCCVPGLSLPWVELMWYFMTDGVHESQIETYVEELNKKFKNNNREASEQFSVLLKNYTLNYRDCETGEWFANYEVELSNFRVVRK